MDLGTTLLRYRYPDGRLQAAFPIRLVESTPERLVGWLPVGSEIAYWATSDGADPRTVPLEARFRQALGTGRRTWSGGSVLRVIPYRERWQVLHFWDADGVFTGWYVNLESEKRVDQHGVVAVDWHLDLLIAPDFEVTWKDEDEAAAAVGTEYLREQDLTAARRTGERIAADPRRFIDSVGHWEDRRPSSEAGRALALPTGWDTPDPARPAQSQSATPPCDEQVPRRD